MTADHSRPESTQLAEAPDSASEGRTDGVVDPLHALIAEIDRGIEQVWGTEPMEEVSLHQATQPSSEQLHVIFRLADSEYAIPISSVREIMKPLATRGLPNVPEWIAGVANMRGEILPVVDLRSLLGLDANRSGREVRMLVMDPAGSELVAGLLVDRVVEVRTLDVDQVTRIEVDGGARIDPFNTSQYEDGGKRFAVIDPGELLEWSAELARAA